jgi:hypothetical protein
VIQRIPLASVLSEADHKLVQVLRLFSHALKKAQVSLTLLAGLKFFLDDSFVLSANPRVG